MIKTIGFVVIITKYIIKNLYMVRKNNLYLFQIPNCQKCSVIPKKRLINYVLV